MNENKNESGIHMILEKSFGSGSRVEKLKGHEEHAYLSIYLSIGSSVDMQRQVSIF
jgi:hypothetical protein